jgi:hypothetical protein
MTKTITISQKIEKHINELVLHSVQNERQNAELKGVIRILAGSVTHDGSGGSSMVMTQDEANYVTHKCKELRIFD